MDACPLLPGAVGWGTLTSLGKLSTQTMQARGTQDSLEYPQSQQGFMGQGYLLEDTQPLHTTLQFMTIFMSVLPQSAVLEQGLRLSEPQLHYLIEMHSS